MGDLFNLSGRSSIDDERFNRLYADTSADLLAFLLRRCPTADDAADCLADTYRIAWEKRTRLPPASEVRPWLFGVARNLVRQAHRSGVLRAAVSRELALTAERAYTTLTPADSALAEAMSELSPLDQEIVMMLSADGLTPREVAAVLGLSPNAVRIRAHRARARLRKLLEGDPDEDTAPSEDTLPAIRASHL